MTYPVVYLKQSDIKEPTKYSFVEAPKMSIGRDDSCDIIIKGHHHISSFHLELLLDTFNELVCIDTSSNGTFIGAERLPTGTHHILGHNLTILDLRMGVELAICHSRKDEASYLKSIGLHTKVDNNTQDSNAKSSTTITSAKSQKNETKPESAKSQPAQKKRPTFGGMGLKTRRSRESSYEQKQVDKNEILLYAILIIGFAAVLIIYGRQIIHFFSG